MHPHTGPRSTRTRRSSCARGTRRTCRRPSARGAGRRPGRRARPAPGGSPTYPAPSRRRPGSKPKGGPGHGGGEPETSALGAGTVAWLEEAHVPNEVGAKSVSGRTRGSIVLRNSEILVTSACENASEHRRSLGPRGFVSAVSRSVSSCRARGADFRPNPHPETQFHDDLRPGHELAGNSPKPRMGPARKASGPK